jgi:FtsP/CotA-like multicopper oxidase with cupredoxin domain
LLLAAAACGDDGPSTNDTTGTGTTDGTPPATTSTDDGVLTSTSVADSTDETTGNETTGDSSGSTGGSTGEYDGNILIPELLQGTEFDLVMDEGTHTFTAGGSPSDTAGYNGDLLGPTLEWVQGDNISISVTNDLAADSTTHWHGAHVSPANDGGPHQMITAGGGTWLPAFEVLNVAATMWYHPHLHEDTANQVRSGLSGFIIVRDDVEAALDLPREYGVDDLPLVLQDKQLDDNGVLQTTPDRGNTMTVNGAAETFREVPGQMVRLRLPPSGRVVSDN